MAFKTGWLRRGTIYSDEGFSVAAEDRSHLSYRSGKKKMTIAGELLSRGGFAGYLTNLATWDDGTPVPRSEQEQIANNIKWAFASQGREVSFE